MMSNKKPNFYDRILTEKFSIRIMSFGFLILVLAFFFFLWQETGFLSLSSKVQADKIGQFGDFIGGLVGSIWALAGVILFVIALREQRNDFLTNKKVLDAQTKALELQIEEFKLQREELKNTRKIFEIQGKTLNKQQFESTFFNLLKIHHEIVSSIDIKDGTNTITGRDCFRTFKREFEVKSSRKSNDNYASTLDFLTDVYWDFYFHRQSDLGHYFTNLYHLFKFIKKSEIDNKRMYTSLVRAQLSDNELFLLFYNCLSNFGREKFKPIIEEFNLLKNLDKDSLLHPSQASLYEQNAFSS